MTDWNAQIIEEFRANDGKVDGMFDGMSSYAQVKADIEQGLAGKDLGGFDGRDLPDQIRCDYSMACR